MAGAEDRGYIRDPVADQLDAGKAAHRGTLDQSLLHRLVAERTLLQQQIDPQHRDKRVGRASDFLARLGVVGLNQIGQCLPGQHSLHLSENFSPLVCFLAVVSS